MDGVGVVSGVFCLPSNSHGLILRNKNRRHSTPFLLGEFISGRENELARIAVESVFQPASPYNPLVFSGQTGVGKTLLLSGIASRWQEMHPMNRLVFTNGADFARDYMDSVQADSVLDFREKHRNCDVLVLDNLNQIDNRPESQFELANTIDTLLENKRKFIAALSSPPAECRRLSTLLISRLSSGLTVPVTVPGKAAKREIIQRLADRYNISLTTAAIDLLTGNTPIDQNLATVPQINAHLSRLATVTDQIETPIDAAATIDCIENNDANQPLTLAAITKSVARYFMLRTSELRGSGRQQRIVRARGVAVLLARHLTDCSLEEIGIYLGNRDHTTILHAHRTTTALAESEPAVRQAVDELTQKLTFP